MAPPWTIGPPGKAQPWDRWDRRALIAAVAIAAWVFALKLKAFFDLCFTSDLFVETQLARSWLEGRFLEDNCYGRHLPIHTFLVLPVLGLLAKPFGAPGLFVPLAAGVGASSLLAHRILRLFGVQGSVALAAGIGLVSLPLSLWVFGDGMGFHCEILIAPLGLGLFYALLRRSLVASLLLAVLICCVKEDAPLAAAAIAIVVLVETRLGERSWHRPALASLAVTLAMFPVLMLIKRIQPHANYEIDHFSRLAASTDGAIRDVGSLLRFVARNAASWVAFSVQRGWPMLFVASTLGALLLRPWLAPLALATTGVAWLLGEDMLWVPRAMNAVAFSWCVTLLGFASALRYGKGLRPRTRWQVAVAGAGFAVVCLLVQLRFVRASWDPIDLHLFRPSHYSASERAQADALFARYRRQGRPEQPVVASQFLFRYAHDRNLYWYDRLRGRPRPIWILQDGEWNLTDFGLRADDYSVVGQNGRFVLLERVSH